MQYISYLTCLRLRLDWRTGAGDEATPAAWLAFADFQHRVSGAREAAERRLAILTRALSAAERAGDTVPARRLAEEWVR